MKILFHQTVYPQMSIEIVRRVNKASQRMHGILNTHEIDPESQQLIQQWFTEKNRVLILYKSDTRVIGFALLHPVDFDPYGQHTKPYVIDLIYVDVAHRKRGVGAAMLEKLKTEGYEMTAFVRLVRWPYFLRRGFVFRERKMGAHVMRWP